MQDACILPSPSAGASASTCAKPRSVGRSPCSDDAGESVSCGGARSSGAPGGAEASEAQLHTDICSALHQGRLLDARRRLARLGDPGRVDGALAERIRRVGVCYSASLEDLAAGGQSWTSEQVGELHYSYRLADGRFQLVSTVESPADPIKALAAVIEVDLCQGYKPNVISTRLLGHEDPDPFDSVWQITQKGRFSGALEDNISHVSVVDALDEELGSLLVCVYPPSDVRSTQLHGIDLPAPQSGAAREGNWRTTFRITPIQDFQGTGQPGFRMSSALNVQPSRAGLAVLSHMPSWTLRLVLARSARELLSSFAKHMDVCEELQCRIESSPRAAFYAHVRCRLMGEPSRAPQPLKMPSCMANRPSVASASSSSLASSKGTWRLPAASTWAGSSAVSTSSSEDCNKGSDHDDWPLGAVGVLSWEEFSAQLPLDWASYQD